MTNVEERDDQLEVENEGGAKPDAETEAYARRLGWRPESEWDDSRRSGARRPDKFLSADEYIKKTEDSMPAMRERLRHSDEVAVENAKKLDTALAQNTELAARLDETSGLVRTLHDQTKEAGKRGYEKARREALAQQRTAVAEADTEAFDRAQQTIDELDRQQAPAEEAPERPDARREVPQRRQDVRVDPVTASWVQQNQWFHRDPALNAFAIREEGKIRAEHPSWPTQDVLDEVRQRAVETFPGDFGVNPRRRAPGSVNEPSAPRGGGERKVNGHSFDELPQEAKDTFARLQKQFANRRDEAGKPIAYTKEEYLQDYQW